MSHNALGRQFSEVDQQILDTEGDYWRYEGAKIEHIRKSFGMTPTRYYQRVNQLIDTPEALSYAPTTVRRLQGVRDRRRGYVD